MLNKRGQGILAVVERGACRPGDWWIKQSFIKRLFIFVKSGVSSASGLNRVGDGVPPEPSGYQLRQ